MGTIAFSDYIASRPAATTPTGTADRLLILQGGEVRRIAPVETGYIVPTVLINGSVTPVTNLPTSGEIVYVKSDDTASICGFAVSVLGQTMCQELINGLSVLGESIRVKLVGTKWYKTG